MCKYKANLKIIPFFLSASILTSFSTFLEHRFSMLTLLFKSRPSTFRKYTPKILMHLALIVSIGSSNASTIVISAGTNTQSIVIVTIGNGNSSIITIVFLTARLKVVAAVPTLRAPSYNYRFPHHC